VSLLSAIRGWLSGHSHHYTLVRWDDEKQCLYIKCWECDHRSYGDAAPPQEKLGCRSGQRLT